MISIVILSLAALGLVGAGFVALVHAAHHAPDGYEDEYGFHRVLSTAAPECAAAAPARGPFRRQVLAPELLHGPGL